MADLADLWGYDDEPPEDDDLPSSRQPLQPSSQQDEDDDCDYLLQDSKRRKLEQRRKAGGGGAGRSTRRPGRARGRNADPEPEVVDLSDSDSDRQLLQEAAARGRAGRDTASSLAAGALPQGRRLPGGTSTHANGGRHDTPAAPASKSAPALDSKASALLQQLQEMQTRMRAAQQQAALSDDGEDASDGPDPSPVVLRGAAALSQQRRQRQQQQQDEAGDAVDLTGDGSGSSRGASPGAPPGGASQGQSDECGAASPGGFGPPAAAAAGAEGDRVLLKLRSSRGEKEMRMRRGDPFSKLFVSYRSWAAAQGHIPSEGHPGLRFVFDGDRLGEEETPEGLDLEGGEIIEVHF
ncbi:hypothetical protein ABPG77_008213 [Micractinium sp. CCAP 211/92]